MRTITPTLTEMEARIARFRAVRPTRETQDAIVPDAVTHVLRFLKRAGIGFAAGVDE